MARILDADGELISSANVAAVEYTIYLLDEDHPDGRIAVDGHAGVTLAVAACISDTLQTDKGWDADAVGWNLRYTIDVATHAAFVEAGRRCLVEFKIWPTIGQVIVAAFCVHVL